MTVIFISPEPIFSINDQTLPTDLMREFIKNGWNSHIVCPKHINQIEKKNLITFSSIFISNNKFLKLFNQLVLPFILIHTLKKNFKASKIDLIIIPTPPITLSPFIKFCKSKYKSFIYLWLKDIFPQNAVDLKLIKKNSFTHKYFRFMEKKTYKLVDSIGCMSDANKKYILDNNININEKKVHISPNCIDVDYIKLIKLKNKKEIFNSYGIKKDQLVIVLGGNIGLPQNPNLIKRIIFVISKIPRIKLIILGHGTHFKIIKSYCLKLNKENIFISNSVDTMNFYSVLKQSDFGLVTLDNKFTIPNFPSRILPYLLFDLKLLLFSDTITDLHEIITRNSLGFNFHYDDETNFEEIISKLIKEEKGKISSNFVKKHWSSKIVFEIITDCHTNRIN